jgi:hypothetical protein
MEIPFLFILRRLIVSFTQNSCAIEGNTLELAETQEIWNLLKKNFDLVFRRIKICSYLHQVFFLINQKMKSSKFDKGYQHAGEFREMK